MDFPRVLVLDNRDFARSVLVQMLRRIGVKDILEANDPHHALIQMHLQGGVDIVMCDLSRSGLEYLDFLRCASQSKLTRSVVLCSELQSELHRALDPMSSLCGLHLHGVLGEPINYRSLRRIVHRYSLTRHAPRSLPPRVGLPTEDEVRCGLSLGEFRAWFQPQFQLRSGAITGIEALVRWEHPARGVLLPEDFLAAVLAYDLIDQMFKQLLEQGLSLLGILRHRNRCLKLAFNLHASQLNDSSLIEHISGALQRHSLNGSTLTFELPENGLLECCPGTRKNLLRLRLLGCDLSIDDFAVGFSSFKSLCQLPFNQIKLDGSFVQRPDRIRNRTLIICTQSLAKSLDMSLVIEGVSSLQVRNCLLELGCESGQGFYLARPMTGHNLLQWLDDKDNKR